MYTFYFVSLTILSLFYRSCSSHTSKKCDITIWHMNLMEHVLPQEAEMTQRQKTTLLKAEQMIERVTKDDKSPLVLCTLLQTYTYIIAPHISSNIMSVTIKETEDETSNGATLSNTVQLQDSARPLDDGGIENKEPANDASTLNNDDGSTSDTSTNRNNDNEAVETAAADNEANNSQDETTKNISRDNIDDRSTKNDAQDNIDDRSTKNDAQDNIDDRSTKNDAQDNTDDRSTKKDARDNIDDRSTKNDVRDNNDDRSTKNDVQDNIDDRSTENDGRDNNDDRSTENDGRDNNDDRSTENDVQDNNDDRSAKIDVQDNNVDRSTENDVRVNNDDRSTENDVRDNNDDRSTKNGVRDSNDDGSTKNEVRDSNDDGNTKNDVRDNIDDRGTENNVRDSNDDRSTKNDVQDNNDDRSTENNVRDNNDDRSTYSKVHVFKEVSNSPGDGIYEDMGTEDDAETDDNHKDSSQSNRNTDIHNFDPSDRREDLGVQVFYDVDTEQSDIGEDGHDKVSDNGQSGHCHHRTEENRCDEDSDNVIRENNGHDSNDDSRDSHHGLYVRDVSGDMKGFSVHNDNSDNDDKISHDIHVISNDDSSEGNDNKKDPENKAAQGNDDESEEFTDSMNNEHNGAKDNDDNEKTDDKDNNDKQGTDDNDIQRQDDNESSHKSVKSESEENDETLSHGHRDRVSEVVEKSGGVVIFYDVSDDAEEEDDEPVQQKSISADPTEKTLDLPDVKQTEESNEETHKEVAADTKSYNDLQDQAISNKDEEHVKDDEGNEGELHDKVNNERNNVSLDHNLKPSDEKAEKHSETEKRQEDNNRAFLYNADNIKSSINSKKNKEFTDSHNKFEQVETEDERKDAVAIDNQSTIDQHKPDFPHSRDHSKLDMEKIQLILAQRESQQAAKIQSLELMLVKLENKILAQSVNKQSDTSAFISLENQILRLENELVKLHQGFRKLQLENESLRTHQRKSYQELEHFKANPRRSEYLALTDNSTHEMMAQQQNRIVELSRMIQNQSAMAQMLQSRSEYLEDQNRQLFQVVMNQTAFLSNIMSKLHELGEEGLQSKIQAEEFKAKLENLRQAQTLQQPTLQEGLQKQTTDQNQVKDMSDPAYDSSAKESPSLASRDLVPHIFSTLKKLLTASSPAVKSPDRWRCAGSNSTMLCIFNAVAITNCTPFSVVQFRACKHMPSSFNLVTKSKPETKQDQGYQHEHDTSMPQEEPNVKFQSEKLLEPANHISRFNSEEIPQSDVPTPDTDSEKNEMKIVTSKVDGNHQENFVEIKYQNEGKFDPDNALHFQPQSDQKHSSHVKSENENLDKGTDTLKENSEVIRNDTANNDENDINNKEYTSNSDSFHNNKGETTIKHASGKADNELSVKVFQDTNHVIETMEMNQNHKYHTIPDEITHVSAATSNEDIARLQCESNDKSPECKLPETTAGVNIAGPSLKVKDESNELIGEIKDQRLKPEHSALEKDNTNKIQMEPLHEGELAERKKAAAEAKTLHEALHRKILYEPLHTDRAKDCYELYKKGQDTNGLRQIYVSGLDVYVSVYCDMKSGGWTLLMKREDGLVDFYRSYEQYKEGFGAAWCEHYLGNYVIHHLTNQGHYSLRAELNNWNGTVKHAYYDHFWIDSEEDDFRLHLLGYSGDAGDGLSKHNGMKFSTFDADHDLLKSQLGGNCAERFHGAGWYYSCYASNLFGRYYVGGQIPEKRFDGIAWKPWLGPGYSLKTATLAVRPFGVGDEI